MAPPSESESPPKNTVQVKEMRQRKIDEHIAAIEFEEAAAKAEKKAFDEFKKEQVKIIKEQKQRLLPPPPPQVSQSEPVG